MTVNDLIELLQDAINDYEGQDFGSYVVKIPYNSSHVAPIQDHRIDHEKKSYSSQEQLVDHLLRRTIQLLKAEGLIGVEKDIQLPLRALVREEILTLQGLVELFPALRHATWSWERSMQARFQVEIEEEWAKWRDKIPQIQFPNDWKVRIIPPLARAVIRFHVNDISIYLDCYDNLGCVGEPYWEIYPAADGDCERFLMADVTGLLDGIKRALAHG